MAASSTEGKPARRGGRGFRRVSASAREPLSRAAGRYGFAAADLLARWPEAAGETFAAVCRPVRVSYGRSRGLGATLQVEADGPHAIEVEMQAPLLLERINAFYGYRAISRLRVTQTGGAGAPPGLAEAQAAWTGPAPADDPQARARAESAAEGAASPALRAALTRLGTYVFAHSHGDGSPTRQSQRSGPGAKRGE
ncbi:MAG TPA: DUF721 domain-containing protein [Thermohalobaculum sp.]|nr:DUF721 domain-containing protein [Thermohalobaculum sp.]